MKWYDDILADIFTHLDDEKNIVFLPMMRYDIYNLQGGERFGLQYQYHERQWYQRKPCPHGMLYYQWLAVL